MPWILLIPGAVLLWMFASRSGEERARRDVRPLGRMPWEHGPAHFAPLAPLPPPRRGPPNMADYIRHLNEACWASRVLDMVKAAAMAADVAALMQAPPEVAQAVRLLCQPIEALFLQRDLNVLGAEPPLPEDGKLDKRTAEAVKALQGRFGIRPTGEVDAETVAAVRYAVGCIYSQDKVAHGG